MSLFADYILERENKFTVEDEFGFATYMFNEDSVYIEIIFVSKEYRNLGKAALMADKIADIARSKGKTKLLGSVCPSANGSTESLKAFIAYGCKLDSCTNNFILLKKDL